MVCERMTGAGIKAAALSHAAPVCALPSPAHAPGVRYKRRPDLQITDSVQLG